MTKDMIKAIRMVNGFNPDLRVKLTNVDQYDLAHWIEENRIGIFGLTSDMCVKPEYGSLEWMEYRRNIKAAVKAVVYGKGE